MAATEPSFRARRPVALAGAAALVGLLLTPMTLVAAATPPLPQIPPIVDPPPIVIPVPTPTPNLTSSLPAQAGLPRLAQPAAATPPQAAPLDPGSPAQSTVPETTGDPVAAPKIAKPEDFTPTAQEALDLPNNLDRLYYEGQQLILSDEFARFEHDFGQAALQAGGGASSFGPPLISNRRVVITQLFGCTEFDLEPYNPGCGSKHWHTGMDWAAPAGMPVFAADAGVVRLFRDARGYGNHAVLIHGNGYVTLYGHLQGFAVQDGQVVRRGDMIGQVGSSGFSTGNHLHFEIRHENVYLDPCAFLGCVG